MISPKLIAPCVGATMALCAIALGAAVGTSSSQAAAAAPASGATGATLSGAVVSSRVLARHVLVDHRVTVDGAVEPALGSQQVLLEQLRRHGGWSVVAHSVSQVAGPFALAFRPRGLGAHTMRLQVADAAGVYDSAATKVEVFHRVLASWYGPGGITACGQVLTASTLGVANRTLPCGTRVTLVYRGHVVRVPVIDRGPYVAGRDYDLTWATKEKLHAADLSWVLASR